MKKNWKDIWGSGEEGAFFFLQSKGYSLNPDASWTHRNPGHTPTPKELDAVDFLKEEWGYKGIK